VGILVLISNNLTITKNFFIGEVIKIKSTLPHEKLNRPSPMKNHPLKITHEKSPMKNHLEK